MKLFIRNSVGRFAINVRASATVATLKAAYIASGKLVGDPGYICLTHHSKVRVRSASPRACMRRTHFAVWCATPLAVADRVIMFVSFTWCRVLGC